MTNEPTEPQSVDEALRVGAENHLVKKSFDAGHASRQPEIDARDKEIADLKAQAERLRECLVSITLKLTDDFDCDKHTNTQDKA